MFQIYNCSPQAEALIDPKIEREHRPILEAKTQAVKYPFKRMQIGHCFVIPNDEQSLSSIKKAVSVANKTMTPVRFKVIRHADQNVTEVARIA